MDAMVTVSTIRKGDTISGPCGYVTVVKVSKGGDDGRVVFDTTGAPFPTFGRIAEHNVWKRTPDAPVAPVEAAPVAQAEATPDEAAETPQEAAEAAPKAPRKRAARKVAAPSTEA